MLFSNLRKDLSIYKKEDFILGGLPCKVADRKDEISEILRNEKSGRNRVKNLIVQEIKEAADGNLALPHYMPQGKSRQDVFAYEGKCWQKIDFDIYIDIIKDCALRIGLPEDISTNVGFMNILYEEVAHAVHQPFEDKVPEGEVWINLQNGTLRISRDGTTLFDEHRRDDYLQYVLPYEYDPSAQCPQWQKFMTEVLPDSATRQLVQEFCGYCFTTNVKAEKMLVLKGNGSNGKSVFMTTLKHLYGKENVSESEFSAVTTDDERRSLLENKLVNISSESSKELDTAILKKLVSGEPVDIRLLYKGSRLMTAIPKFITSYNVMPRPEQTNAFFRRWILVPFMQTFTGKLADKELDKKLLAELPGILNWVIEGLQRLVANHYNFTESEECNKALDHYRKSGDSAALFIDDCCEPFDGAPTTGAKILEAYKYYCLKEEISSLGKKKLFDHLENVLGIKRRNPSNVPHFDLTLKPDLQ